MDTKKLIASLSMCFSVAIIGGWATSTSITSWFNLLTKPELSPPNWIFGPVWTCLYFLMAVALALIWSTHPKTKVEVIARSQAIQVFILQLGLNLLWSFLFFYYHTLFWSMLEILVLLATISYTIITFRKVKPQAANLLLPYFLWVSFATYLTITLWILN